MVRPQGDRLLSRTVWFSSFQQGDVRLWGPGQEVLLALISTPPREEKAFFPATSPGSLGNELPHPTQR